LVGVVAVSPVSRSHQEAKSAAELFDLLCYEDLTRILGRGRRGD